MERSAGILLPVFSLPGPYGIGSLGREARAFAEFLHNAGQRWWQVLPVGPTGAGNSPYTSESTFAGNPLLIDLEDLRDRVLLTEAELSAARVPEGAPIDYAALYESREALLRRAFSRLGGAEAQSVRDFAAANPWLGEYALYRALKARFGQTAWFDWPDKDLLNRDPAALAAARQELAEDIAFHQAVQFWFFSQWKALKDHANGLGVRISNGLGVKLLPQYAGHIQQIKFVGADPLLALGHTRAVCRFGAGRACKGVDKGGLAYIGDAAQHHLRLGTAHAAVLAAFQQAGQFFFDRSLNGIGTALLLGADRHTAGICCTEVSDPFFRYSRIGQICLVQRIELRLAGRDALDLRVQAGERDAGIQQHKACIHMLDLLLHHAQGLGHVAREPLNIVLVCKAGIHFVHFTTPKSVKGIKHTSTLPRISRSSMQPT